MTDTMPKLTIQELSETTKAANYIASWGPDGDLRSFAGEVNEPASRLERSAMIAFEAIAPKFDKEIHRGGSSFQDDRNEMIDLISNGMRLAVVEERQNAHEERTDLQRARSILISTALVVEGRAAHDGGRDFPFDFTALENIRKLAGLQDIKMDRPEAGAIGVGMADLIERKDLEAKVAQTIGKGKEPFADQDLEFSMMVLSSTLPQIRVRDAGPIVSAGKGAESAPEMSELAKAMAGMDKQR